MIDLFGLGKTTEPEPQERSEGPEEPAAPRGSHRLWAFLLVLDSVFVIIFGGAVAAKIYQYWKTPGSPAASSARRRPQPPTPKAEEPAPKPAEPAPAPAPPAAPPAPEPAAASKPEPAARPDAPRPPKPSLLNEGPRPRGSAKPAAGPVVETPAAAASGRARPVHFSLSAPGASSVQLVGAFIVRGGRKDMTRKADGTWALTLYLTPGQYRYFFMTDKRKMLDPENPRADRGASLLTVP